MFGKKNKNGTDRKRYKDCEITFPGMGNEVSDAYWKRQSSMSPKQYYMNTRFYWVVGIILLAISYVFLELGIQTVKSRNAATSITFLRIDGLVVNESNDVRRDVLFEATLRRQQLLRGVSQTNSEMPAESFTETEISSGN